MKRNAFQTLSHLCCLMLWLIGTVQDTSARGRDLHAIQLPWDIDQLKQWAKDPSGLDFLLDDNIELPIQLREKADVVFQPETWHGPDDLSAGILIGWNQDHLYLRINVRDDRFVPAKTEDQLVRGDHVELWFAELWGGRATSSQIGIGWLEGASSPVVKDWTEFGLRGRVISSEEVSAFSKRNADGYVLVVAIPLAALNIRPKYGSWIGIMVEVSDTDDRLAQETLLSTSRERRYRDATSFNTLKFPTVIEEVHFTNPTTPDLWVSFNSTVLVLKKAEGGYEIAFQGDATGYTGLTRTTSITFSTIDINENDGVIEIAKYERSDSSHRIGNFSGQSVVIHKYINGKVERIWQATLESSSTGMALDPSIFTSQYEFFTRDDSDYKAIRVLSRGQALGNNPDSFEGVFPSVEAETIYIWNGRQYTSKEELYRTDLVLLSIIKGLSHEDEEVRSAAAPRLESYMEGRGRKDRFSVIKGALLALEDESQRVRVEVARVLVDASKSAYNNTRVEAEVALCMPVLIEALSDESPQEVRQQAVNALKRIGTPDAMGAVERWEKRNADGGIR